MLLPTAVFLARQLPGPLNDITDAGKDVATTATDAGKTATDAGKTATDVGKDVADQAQVSRATILTRSPADRKSGVNQFNEYKGLLESLQDVSSFTPAHAWLTSSWRRFGISTINGPSYVSYPLKEADQSRHRDHRHHLLLLGVLLHPLCP